MNCQQHKQQAIPAATRTRPVHISATAGHVRTSAVFSWPGVVAGETILVLVGLPKNRSPFSSYPVANSLVREGPRIRRLCVEQPGRCVCFTGARYSRNIGHSRGDSVRAGCKTRPGHVRRQSRNSANTVPGSGARASPARCRNTHNSRIAASPFRSLPEPAPIAAEHDGRE
jgi:hypothetical protein